MAEEVEKKVFKITKETPEGPYFLFKTFNITLKKAKFQIPQETTLGRLLRNTLPEKSMKVFTSMG